AAAAVGWSLCAFRACTVVASLLSLFFIFRWLRGDPHNRFLFLPLLVFGISSPAIYFNRWGFTYNFLAPLFLYVSYRASATATHHAPPTSTRWRWGSRLRS